MKTVLALILALAAGQGLAAELDRTPLEAATVDGKKVRLFPNGRWEYVDAAMAAEAQKLAAEYPENKARPATRITTEDRSTRRCADQRRRWSGGISRMNSPSIT